MSRYPMTTVLPRGAQAQLMNASTFAASQGHPVNTHTTINAAYIQRMADSPVFGIGHLWDGMKYLLELMRKWHLERGIPWTAIWARENTGKDLKRRARQPGEHWHIAHHLPRIWLPEWNNQVVSWTGIEAPTISINANQRTIRARSAHDEWQVTYRPRQRAEEPGIYLGKAEPGWICLHGKRKPNTHKPRRDKCGGEGPIEGKRFGITRSINTKAQKDAGFIGPYGTRKAQDDNRPERPVYRP